MIRLLFALGIFLNGATAGVFVLNFIWPPLRPCVIAENQLGQQLLGLKRYRHPASLVCGALSTGWCVALAREMAWLPRPYTTLLISIALPLGLLGLLIVLNSRRQRPM